MEKLKRYIIFMVGLFINSLGVSFVTKASLGTSPISSIPYVLSLNFPFTLGEFTIFFSLLLIVFQLVILRRNFKLEHILQIPISILFGYFIDFTMILLQFINPQSYAASIVYLLIGCLILGFGVYLEVLADVAMLPGESFVRSIVATWHTEFGTTKIIFDVSMTVIAALLSLCFTQRLSGVREGTVIAALLVGFISRLFGRILSFLPDILFPQRVRSASQPAEAAADSFIITIGRQYGCGGHDIGKILSDKLGYPLYDKEIIKKTAGFTGYDSDYISKNEEAMTNSLLYDLVNQMYSYSSEHHSPKDTVFEAESKVIREIAQQGSCIIIGRCADEILKDYPNCFKVWLHAPKAFRIQRIMQQEQLDEAEAASQIMQGDKRRAANYHYYTNKIWGLAKNFHVSFDTELGMDFVADSIIRTFEVWKK